MDTSNREGFWLENFPPDIWAYFVWYMSGEQLGRLMMTGATLIRQRLKSPTVVKHINLGQDFLVFHSFPRFLNDFSSLEELSIHSCNEDWARKLSLNIGSIPSGVRKLECSGIWGDLLPDLFGSLIIFDHLPHLETLSLDHCPGSSWMTHSPRSLTDLKLHSWDGTVELPPSLIHFEARNADLSTSSFVSKLPSSLETFSITDEFSGADLVVPLLPGSTKKLFLGSPKNNSDPESLQSLLERLPKFLEWLFVSENWFVANPELVSLLPSSITTLDLLEGLPCSTWHLLPQQITYLGFTAPKSLCTVVSNLIDKMGKHHRVTSIPFDTLPRSITKLELFESYDKQYQFFCGPPSAHTPSYFPPQLTYLQISGIQLSPETAKLLPSSLLHLHIGNLGEQVCQHLPKSLQTLASYGTLLSPNLIKFLPKSLTSLRFNIYNAYVYWFDDETGEEMELISVFAGQPPENSPPNCFASFSLPSTLTSFILNSVALGDSFMQHQQLPNLLELKLDDTKDFTDLSIPLLSSRLTTLNLASSSNISGRSLKSLSRCLTYLNLKSSESIFDADIQHLPRTLKEVHFNSAIHLTDLCIPDLPPHLVRLNMIKNSRITPSSFPNFPYPLRYSQFYRTTDFADWCISKGVVQTNRTQM